MQAEFDPDCDWVERLSGESRGDAEAAIREAQAERRLFAQTSRTGKSDVTPSGIVNTRRVLRPP